LAGFIRCPAELVGDDESLDYSPIIVMKIFSNEARGGVETGKCLATLSEFRVTFCLESSRE
jgi:hypothetical protein